MLKNKKSDKSDNKKFGKESLTKNKKSNSLDGRKKSSIYTKNSSSAKKNEERKKVDAPKKRTIKKDVDFVESKLVKKNKNDDFSKDLYAKKSSEKSFLEKKKHSSDKFKKLYTQKTNERNNYEKKTFVKSEKTSRFEKPLKSKQTTNFKDNSDFNLDNLDLLNKEKQKIKKTPIPKSLKNILKTSTSESGDVRLNKIISNAGICSRREADDFITAGVVKVNGKVVSELGYKVKSNDVVTYNGETIRREKLVYYLMNKPKDFITTTDDPQDRKTVMNLISGIKERIYPVGRLDRNTTGILIFTNDGDLTKKLTHPSFNIKKIYHAFLDKPFKKEDLIKLKEGIYLHDGFIKPDELSYVAGAKSKNEIGIELHSGKNRIVRRIFEHLGYVVDRLDRVYFAGLTKKDLKRGDWRELTEREIAFLKSL